ncbi:hypothetical protein VKT23_011121 [Stygiomarasmius scandens]|uniref:Uncharacterized protein n=1 Tax=Marasmiellus scandens TaxID=2682957 RepID=A0ABR1JAU5_9AGAR
MSDYCTPRPVVSTVATRSGLQLIFKITYQQPKSYSFPFSYELQNAAFKDVLCPDLQALKLPMPKMKRCKVIANGCVEMYWMFYDISMLSHLRKKFTDVNAEYIRKLNERKIFKLELLEPSVYRWIETYDYTGCMGSKISREDSDVVHNRSATDVGHIPAATRALSPISSPPTPEMDDGAGENLTLAAQSDYRATKEARRGSPGQQFVTENEDVKEETAMECKMEMADKKLVAVKGEPVEYCFVHSKGCTEQEEGFSLKKEFTEERFGFKEEK